MEKYTSDAVDWKEGRRLRALELSQQGWRQKEIAVALGVSKGAVSQWMKRVREEGPQGLRRRKAHGAPRRLSLEDRAKLPQLLERGPEAYGFRGALWTEGRIVEVIRREFGVKYHPSHVGRILRACGWSLQKPMRRAIQRNEEAIGTWREERWPEVKKKPSKRGVPSSS